MICEQLPSTGLDPSVGLPVIAALVCLVVGLGIALVARRRRLGLAAALGLVVVFATTSVLLPGQPVRAASAQCSTTSGSVTVVQTSVMDGLAPGIAPTRIVGLVENTGAASLHVSAVDVEITSVSVQPGAAVGACDPSDYVLLDTHMIVDRPLDVGRSTPFDGAVIGFSDKAVVQDACQNATVHLLYTVHAVEI